VRRARQTVVEPGAVVASDALLGGDGGKVSVWATGRLTMAGRLRVQGGPLWGHGGLVEVSGKESLQLTGTIYQLSGGNGRSGRLVIDPDNVNIEDVPLHDPYLPTIIASQTSATGGTFFISSTAIQNALAIGDVYIAATTNIKIYNPIVSTADNNHTFTLKCGNVLKLFEFAEITTRGKLKIEAGGGVELRSSVHADDSVDINADTDNSGLGGLTLYASMTVTTQGHPDQPISVKAGDMYISGTISAGAAPLVISPTGNNALGLGFVAKDMHLSDDELGRITTSNIQIGSSTAGSMYIDRITNHPKIGPMDIIATGPGGTIEFAPSFEGVVFAQGVTLAAMNGMKIMTDVTSIGRQVSLSSGTGTLTVAASKSFLTTNQALVITTNDLDFQSGSEVSSGTESTTIHCFSGGTTIGLGVGVALSKQFSLSGADLQRIITDGFSVGGGNCGTLTVAGMTPANSGRVTGLVSLMATRDDTQVEFAQIASTFHVVAVQADNGIQIKADLTTVTGSLYLDGDIENSSSADGANYLSFTDGRTVYAKTVLTLEATTGAISQGGHISMKAGAGIIIAADAQGFTKNTIMTLNADADTPYGDGTLTIVTSKTLTTNDGHMQITAWDLNLSGGVDTGNSTLSIHASVTDQTIGLGFTPRSLWLTDSEMGRLAGEGLVIGSSLTGSITVDGSASSMSLLVTLVATAQYRQVIFEGRASTFDGLHAFADDGVVVRKSVTTTTGPMHLDGDSDDNKGLDIVNNVEFSAATTTTAKQVMTVESTSGTLLQKGALTLAAGAGIVLLNDLQGVATGKELVLSADYDGGGDGSLTVTATKTVTSNKGDIVMTAWDVDMDGMLTAGTRGLSIHGAVAGQTIGLGNTVENMHVSGVEMQRMTGSNGLRVGGTSGGNIVIDGLTGTHSTSIGEALTIVARYDGATVTFHQGPATFKALGAQADNGIVIATAVTTNGHYLYLDGDVENSSSADDPNSILFKNATAIQAKTVVTLEASAGKLQLGAAFTIQAGTGVVILDRLEGVAENATLVINADYEVHGDGTLTVAAGKVIATNNNPIVITAWDVDLSGSITVGTDDVSIHGSKSQQTIGMGDAVKDMHLLGLEVGSITATGLTVGNSGNGNIAVNGLSAANTQSVSSVFSVVARGDNINVEYSSQASTFNTMSTQADNGIMVKVDLMADEGALWLDGDDEDSSSSDSHNAVELWDGIAVMAKTLLTVESTQGVILQRGALTMKAGAGIVLLNDVRGVLEDRALVLNADYDGGNDGTLTVAAGKLVTSNKGDITITAWDIDMDGMLTAGNKGLSIHGATVGQTISLGVTNSSGIVGNMHVDGAEFGRMTAVNGLRVGASQGGTITVSGVTEA